MLFGIFKNLKPYKDLLSEDFFHAITSDNDAIILDVRNATDFKSEKISGAQNLDINTSSFVDSIKKLPKDKTYYIYCRSGIRSANACRIMAKYGFKNLFNLYGGLLNYKEKTQKHI